VLTSEAVARRDRLITEHAEWARGIARHVAGKLPTWFTVEDLTGAAELALVEVAAKYDPGRGVTFPVFAQRRVRGACFSSVRRKEYRERAHKSLDAPLNQRGDGREESSLTKASYQAVDPGDSPERLAELEQMKSIWHHVDGLKDQQATVIRAMYGEGLTNKETSQFMHVSEGYVSQLHAEALAALNGLASTPAIRPRWNASVLPEHGRAV
jgi:RNA polymerase sigma factor for flagellar operon FliA